MSRRPWARIRLSDEERAGLQRVAEDLYARGFTAPAHLLSVFASKREVSGEEYNCALAAYRSWLQGKP